MTRTPPPPIPHVYGSVTPSTAAAATAASTAFPPWLSTPMAACVANGSTVAAAPPVPTATACFGGSGGLLATARSGASIVTVPKTRKRAKAWMRRRRPATSARRYCARSDLSRRLGCEHRAGAKPDTLRVTTVFRCEDGEWKVVHRHADPLPDSDSARAQLGRLSDERRDR